MARLILGRQFGMRDAVKGTWDWHLIVATPHSINLATLIAIVIIGKEPGRAIGLEENFVVRNVLGLAPPSTNLNKPEKGRSVPFERSNSQRSNSRSRTR